MIYEFTVIVVTDDNDMANSQKDQKQKFQDVISDISNALDNTNTETRITSVHRIN